LGQAQFFKLFAAFVFMAKFHIWRHFSSPAWQQLTIIIKILKQSIKFSYISGKGKL
jgi:hypothetical protein